MDLPEPVNFFRYFVALFLGTLRDLPYMGVLYSFCDFFMSLFLSVLRLGSGSIVAGRLDECHRPRRPLEIFENECCPFSRKVRETLSVLDIQFISYPCPKDSLSQIKGGAVLGKFFPELANESRKAERTQPTTPFLRDPNVEPAKTMFESDQIVKYLCETYGNKATYPLNYKLAMNTKYFDLTMNLQKILRCGTEMGILRIQNKAAVEPLILISYEGSIQGRRIKETLSALEIPHSFVPTALWSKHFQLYSEISSFEKKAGILLSPLVVDPNTGKTIRNIPIFSYLYHDKIVQYLRDTYMTGTFPKDSWLDVPWTATPNTYLHYLPYHEKLIEIGDRLYSKKATKTA